MSVTVYVSAQANAAARRQAAATAIERSTGGWGARSMPPMDLNTPATACRARRTLVAACSERAGRDVREATVWPRF
jgi:hypothetical protein